MDCPYIPELSLGEFGERLRERIAGRRIPIKGSMELTFRCNLRCVHCYLSHGHQGIPGWAELSYEEICDILIDSIKTMWMDEDDKIALTAAFTKEFSLDNH